MNRYRDWRYLRSLGWDARRAFMLLRLLAFGASAGEALRQAEAL